MAQFQGILLALAAAFFFGVYIIPRKNSRIGAIEYQFWLCLSLPLMAYIFLAITRSRLCTEIVPVSLSMLCGVLWALGATAYSRSADLVGITRSTLVKNFGPVLTTLYGVALFSEFSLDEPIEFAAAIVGSLLMFGATIVIAKCKSTSQETALAYQPELQPEQSKKLFINGYLLAIVTGFCFSAYTIPMQHVLKEGWSAVELMFWMTVGALVSSAIIYLSSIKKLWPPKTSWGEYSRCQMTAVFWILAGLAAAFAMSKIPMGVSWPITNLCAIVTLAFGVWMYREVQLKDHWKEVLLGSAFYIVGIALLGFSIA